MISAKGTGQDTSPIRAARVSRDEREGRPRAGRGWRAILGALGLAGMMVVLLWSGFSNQVRPPDGGTWGDVYRYQCFAVAFWEGPQAMQAVDAVRPTQCDDVQRSYRLDPVQTRSSERLHGLGAWLADHADMTHALHSLPVEYPVLALVPFSLPLIAPAADYPIAFGLEMTLIALGLFALLAWRASWRAAGFFAVCMGIGAWATGIDRFDLLPAGLTLVALLLAQRRRWTWAYLSLAAGVFLKYYPLVLVLPLVVAQLRASEGPLRERLRTVARPVGAFVGVCAALLLLSLLINPVIFYRQIATLSARPLEVESVPASLVWLGARAGIPMRAFVAFGSDNVSSPLASAAVVAVTLAALAALALALWGLWSGRTSLPRAWLAALMVVTIAGKVFSAQYLIWLLPIAAVAVPLEGFAPLAWLAVCALTTFSFPFLWRSIHAGWHDTIAIRNALVLVLLASLLPLAALVPAWRAARQSTARPVWRRLTSRRPGWAVREPTPSAEG